MKEEAIPDAITSHSRQFLSNFNAIERSSRYYWNFIPIFTIRCLILFCFIFHFFTRISLILIQNAAVHHAEVCHNRLKIFMYSTKPLYTNLSFPQIESQFLFYTKTTKLLPVKIY